jgi:hypothetical protein
MTYACPASEFASDTNLLKLQLLQNKILHTIGRFPKCTSVGELHTAFQIRHIYDYITQLCNPQAEVLQNHENVQVTRQPL